MVSARQGDVVQGWILEQSIGSGSFATVWKAHKSGGGTDNMNADVAAIKIIATDKLSSKLRQSLECEVSILKRISHRNVVKLYEVLEERNCIYLVMEFCGGGDVSEYLRKHRRVSESVAKEFMQQLSAGLQELWQHHFVHRDLKPQNLLLSDESLAPVVKIADFGFARDLQPQRMADTLCGSPLYMAPEILRFHKYDAKADLWSVGVILYELLVGKTPFDGSNHVQLLRNIEREEAHIPEAFSCQLSNSCVTLICQLLKRNPVERIAFEEFFRHPFLTSAAATSLSPPRSPCTSSGVDTQLAILPTIASGVVLPLSTTSDEVQLPFSVLSPGRTENQEQALQPLHGPPMHNRRPLLADTSMPIDQQCTGSLQGAVTAEKIDQSRKNLQNSLEDEDYVIIEHSLSSSATRTHSQALSPAAAAAKALLQSVPLPLPTTVPLLLQPLQSGLAKASEMQPGLGALATSIRFTSGLSQVESFKRTAILLEDLAMEKQQAGAYEASLAVRLLSLQVMSAVLGVPSPDGSCMPDQNAVAATTIAGIQESGILIHTIADRAAQVAGLLSCTEAGLQAPLPDVWSLLYYSALESAKAAAVDELLCNYAASIRAYTKAGALLYFIFADSIHLALQPPLQLTVSDQRRLQRYTAWIAVRHQGCVTGASMAKKPQRPEHNSLIAAAATVQTAATFPRAH